MLLACSADSGTGGKGSFAFAFVEELVVGIGRSDALLGQFEKPAAVDVAVAGTWFVGAEVGVVASGGWATWVAVFGISLVGFVGLVLVVDV